MTARWGAKPLSTTLPLLIALLLGLASAFAFEPVGLWPLMPLAFAGLLAMLARAATMRRALALGWLFGWGQFVVGLNWIATAFTFQAAMPAWLGWVAVVLLSAYLAVYPAMATGLAWRYGRARPDRLVPLLAAAWIVTEWLRGTMFTGFAWNPVGVSLLDAGGTAGWSRLVGTYGLSGITVLAGGAVWLLIEAFRREGREGWGLSAVFAPIGLFVVVGWLGGLLIPSPPPPRADRALRIVQPNIGQQNKHDPAFRDETWTRLTALTGAPNNAAPRLVLWPEAAIPDFPEDSARTRARLGSLIRPQDVLLTGAVALERNAAGRAVGGRNSLFVVTPPGRLLARYDKAHLVPYGEYLPMRPLLSALGASRLVPGDLEFWPGPGARTLPVPGFGRMGVQICYEVIFSGEVVDDANRPDFLFNPSNDAWFGRWGPPQHLAQARLRALEEGLPAVRATPTGISAVIGANGRLLASLPWQRPGAIDAALPRPLPPTPFARAGNILPFLFAGLLVVLAFARRRPRV